MSEFNILPDSRLASDAGAIMADWPLGDGRTVRLEMVPVFCANCGTPGGYVPKENTVFAFYLCQLCLDTYGVVAGTMVESDDAFRRKVAYEVRQRFGYDATAEELGRFAEHGQLGSALEKLVRESPYKEFNR